MKRVLLIWVFLASVTIHAQVLLNANGAGNTYEEITAVLAPGYNPIEVPDCDHSAFGRHIDEIFDTDLNDFVFRFFLHTSPDNDRCINFDRQRNEIKSYDKSLDNLLGIEGEIVVYKWKFKLDSDLQVSPNFTHIHQLKSMGGSLASKPMYTLTLRKSNPDRLELRYAETNTQITLKQSDLQPFKGVWLDVMETIQYGTSGTYAIQIKKVSDNSILFEYENDNIINWRPNADFVRPKWGIYRSLINDQDLRDEEVLFANFSVEELETLSTDELTHQKEITLYPNPATDSITISEKTLGSYDSVSIVNILGQVLIEETSGNKTIGISRLGRGTYFVVFKKNNKTITTKKLVVQ